MPAPLETDLTREIARLKNTPGLHPETLALIAAALKTQTGALDLEGAVAIFLRGCSVSRFGALFDMPRPAWQTALTEPDGF